MTGRTIGIAFAALLMAGAAPAAGQDGDQDGACETTFRTLLAGKAHGYPFTARSVNRFNGTETASLFTAESPTASMTVDERTGLHILMRDGKSWQSADKGATWTFLYEIPANQRATMEKTLTDRAASATDITCTDAVAYDDKPYRQLTGRWPKDAQGMTGTATYYLDDTGTWQVAVTEINMNGQKSKITQVRLEETGEMPEGPED